MITDFWMEIISIEGQMSGVNIRNYSYQRNKKAKSISKSR